MKPPATTPVRRHPALRHWLIAFAIFFMVQTIVPIIALFA